MRSLLFSSIAVIALPLLSACSDQNQPLFEGLEIPVITTGDPEPEVLPTQRLRSYLVTLPSGTTVDFHFTYSASGNVATRVRSENEVLTSIWTYETKLNGEIIRVSKDNDLSGIENRASTYTYAEGFGPTRIYDYLDSGDIGFVDLFYFEDGLVVSKLLQDIDNVPTEDLVDDASGEVYSRAFYTYENGYLTAKETYLGDAGGLHRTVFYYYNPDGTISTSELYDPEGTRLNSVAYAYEDGPCKHATYNSTNSYRCVDIRP